MKWSTIIASISSAALFAILLIAYGMHLGQQSAPPQPAPQAYIAPPAPPAPASPQPNFGARRGAGAPVARNNPPRPAPAPIPTPALATSALLSQPATLTGTLRTVETTGVLTCTPVDAPAGPPQIKGLLADKATQISLDGKPADLAALKPGMDIAYLDNGDKPLDKLEAFALLPDNQPHTKQGPIDKISATELVLLAGRKDLFPVALNISADTPATIDGNPAKISDLRYRMLVAVKYQATDALSIAASTVILDGQPHHADGNLAAAASSDGFTIHVYGNTGFDIKLKSDPNLKIQKETGRAAQPTLVDATLADLKAGLHVVATYTDGTAADLTIKLAGGAGPARAAPAPTARTPATPKPAPTPTPGNSLP